jgi:hypothetical protein
VAVDASILDSQAVRSAAVADCGIVQKLSVSSASAPLFVFVDVALVIVVVVKPNACTNRYR